MLYHSEDQTIGKISAVLPNKPKTPTEIPRARDLIVAMRSEIAAAPAPAATVQHDADPSGPLEEAPGGGEGVMGELLRKWGCCVKRGVGCNIVPVAHTACTYQIISIAGCIRKVATHVWYVVYMWCGRPK